ncbi:MAG: cytochrome P450 [Acidimicrobiales bacterium]
MALAAANRDPGVYEDPDAFSIDREGPPALSFGAGPHLCLGAHLARLEVEVMLAHLVGHCEAMTLAGPEPEWRIVGPFRGLSHLYVNLRRSAL